MGKYDFAIKVLGEKLTEVGSELYTLELVKKDKNGEAMAALFGGLMGSKDRTEDFSQLVEAINVLKETGEQGDSKYE